MVALLDVPLGLSQAQTLQWRARFNSSYAAAYHPWLQVSRADDQRNDPVRLNPSAAAAGIIAARELAFGVPHGPANQVVVGAFDVSDRVSPQRHTQLHPLGINVYLRERAGIRLSAARTLSRARHYRQLSVRRLMLMLRRALEQQMQWAVFEPNGPRLWSDVRLMLRNYLRSLYRAGAFRGGSEEEAFFVRCDAETNDRPGIDAGRMLAEVGVAPAEPLEFIVVRITRGGDGTLTLET
jgi:phage tail sheath protein FI